MDNTGKKSLLPDFIKQSVVIPFVFIIPQIILLLINLRAFWLIRDEIPPDKMYVGYAIFGIEIILLGAAFFICRFLKGKKTDIRWGWNVFFFTAHIGYLWYFISNFWQFIPAQIEPWILDTTALLLQQFTFMMPGLFYAGMRLACFEVKLKTLTDLGVSILIAVLAPLLYYVLFIGIGVFSRSIGRIIPEFLIILLFIGITVIGYIGLIRLIVLTSNSLRTKSIWAQVIFAFCVGLLGPVAGLLLNKGIPFPADFQSPWVYILAVLNGLIVLIPGFEKNRVGRYILFARSLTYPFTLYFFLVFLPFLPISLPAVFAVGLGFLFLVPVILFLLHTKKLYDDFKSCAKTGSVIAALLLTFTGVSVLPAYFTFEAFKDKTSLQTALKYVYSPDYSRDTSFEGCAKSISKTLLNLKRFKNGIQLPYLSGFYNRVVFEGMVLPDKNIDYMFHLFTGEDLSQDMLRKSPVFGRGRGAWLMGTRAAVRDRNVELASINVDNQYCGDIVKSRVRLEMHNAGENETAEFYRAIHVPRGVLITDFKLKVGEDMVAGQIFEKRAAMWVYHMIRDWTRRDPGLLTYKSPTQIDLNVYPFTKDQTRLAEIEFQFPSNLNPQVSIGERAVSLIQTAQGTGASPVLLKENMDGSAVAVIPGQEMEKLPEFRRQPYLHFILDFSKNTGREIRNYAQQIYSLAQERGVNSGKITAANFNIEELTSDFIPLENKDIIAGVIEKTILLNEGAVDLSRVIKHHLIEYYEKQTDVSNDYYWKHYPVFVFITGNKAQVKEFDNLEFFSLLVPESGQLVTLLNTAEEIKTLWPVQEKNRSEEVVILKLGNSISVLPAITESQVARFERGNVSDELSAYNPQTDRFEPVSGVMNCPGNFSYEKGLSLFLENEDILRNPARFDKELAALVKRSQDIGVMIPSTSYIIVERSSQWKTLEVKEKERLKSSEGLEFEDFDTPAPPLWILLLLLLLWHLAKNKRAFLFPIFLFIFFCPPVLSADWSIIKGESSTAMDSLAASELQRYVQEITAVAVPIITDKEAFPTDNIFLVGKAETNKVIGELVEKKLIKINDRELGPEGFINKVVDVDGRHYVVLAGCDESGVQYAVYDFLESYCKVGFLLDGDNVPFLPCLEVKNLDVSKKPFCAFRQQSVYGKCKLWYGGGSWVSLENFQKDGYTTGWKDFIDWMIKKKQNVLYLKRGSFNIGYILGFPELNTPEDIAAIDSDRYWFKSSFAAEVAKQLIAYAKSRGMKVCYTATICRMPKSFKKCIENPRHPCYGLKYEDKGSWLRLDPLDERSYSYCLKRQVEAIIGEFGKPDFWYGYYGWSEQALTMGLPFRSFCHYKAYDLVFKKAGGSLLVYTWDWGGFGGLSLDKEWQGFKKVMPKNGRVILMLNNALIPEVFLNDPQGPFGGYSWWKYVTATEDNQWLPGTFGYAHLSAGYAAWKKILQTCKGNPPQGFGIDNMIHHVDQRFTDFECAQSFGGNADKVSLDDYLADYTQRAYGQGANFEEMFTVHKLWTNQRKLTIEQIEQYMIPAWFELKNNIIYRTDLTEALFYEASDYDKCALLYDKWIYSNQFTIDWTKTHIPANAWVMLSKKLWEEGLQLPREMTYESKMSFLEGIKPGVLTLSLADKDGNPISNKEVQIKRGYLTKIKFPESFKVLTDTEGKAQIILKPDVYEIDVPDREMKEAVLMLHNRNKAVTLGKDETIVTEVITNQENFWNFDKDIIGKNAKDWVVIQGNWGVTPDNDAFAKSNVYSSQDKDKAIALLDKSYDDFTFEVQLKLLSEYGAGIYFRYQDDNNYYRFRVDTRTPGILLHKVVNGINTTLVMNEQTVTKGNWYTLKVTAKGNVLQVFIDGVQIARIIDESFAKGKLGLMAYTQCYFDDVKIQRVD